MENQTDATAEVTEAKKAKKSWSFFGPQVAENALLNRIRKYFRRVAKKPKPQLASSVDRMMSLVCGMGCLSFRAYNDPHVDGFEEVTSTGCRLRHLNYEALDDVVEGVLKIHLERAFNVIDADLVMGASDPYVVFSTGWSRVASETINNETNPVWNSTHYLLVRKSGVIERDVTTLNIQLYDSDATWGKNAERTFRQVVVRDDFLGSATVDLSELKQPGVHKKQVTLHLDADNRAHKTTVDFSAEFLPFDQVCAELGKEKGSGVWSKEVQSDSKWTELSMDSEVQHVTYQPIAFVNCMHTGTQVWIHANIEAKAMGIAFRGTEADKLKDLLTDLSVLPTRLSWQNGGCSLRFTDVVMEKNIRVHSGFRTAYHDWTIYVTGHSLGGALATLCTFDYSNRTDDAGNRPEVIMMNFGAPRVGNRPFKHAYAATVHESYRVVNKLDIIHKIPVMLKHVPREISFEEDGNVIVDKQISVKVDRADNVEENEGESSRPPVRKMTKKSMFSGPGFKGHFEDYYLNVVTRAVGTLVKDQKKNLKALVGGLTRDPDAEKTQPKQTPEKQSKSTETEIDDSAAESSRTASLQES